MHESSPFRLHPYLRLSRHKRFRLCTNSSLPGVLLLIPYAFSRQVLSDDSTRGGISFIMSKGDGIKSILLIENADLTDSGKYSCYPSNTDIASIRVHVLNGKFDLCFIEQRRMW